MLEIVDAQIGKMPIVRELFLEYASSLDFDLAFQGFKEELASLPGNYSSPGGCILLALIDSVPAGCVALRPLSQDISEMKRLYVRPTHQGFGIGRALSEMIVEKAVRLGYQKIRLDTVPSMKAAISMYRSMGFHPIPPYRQNPIPGTSYLEKSLQI